MTRLNKKLVVILALLLFLYIGKGSNTAIGQTAPAVDDPRIEARWVHQADSDLTAVLGKDVIGERTVNVLIVAEGFMEATKESFFSYSEKQGAFFLKNVPLPERFNLIAVWLPSVDDGIDIPEEGIVKDTPLDSKKRGEILDIQKNPTPFLERILQRKKESRDFIAVICNTLNDYILSSTNITVEGQVKIVSLTLEKEMRVFYDLTHELGHLIAGLRDEYLAVGTGKKKQEEFLASQGGVVSYPNLIGNVNWPKDAEGFPIIPRSDIPWADLIPEGVPIPTTFIPAEEFGEVYYTYPEEFVKKVGVFGPDLVLFAPNPGNCLMSGSGQMDNPNIFCPVCERQWKKVIMELLRPEVVTVWSAAGISENDQPFPDTLKHEFQWKNDGEWFYATGLLLRNPYGDDRAFLQISIPKLKGVENKKEFWKVVSENDADNPDPVLGWDIVDRKLSSEFSVVVFVRSDININQMSKFRVEADIPEYGKFVVKSALDRIIVPEQPTPTATPILPTPTPTVTPKQTVISNVILSSLNGKVAVNWLANGDPDRWEVHLYRFNNVNGKNEYFSRKEAVGSSRMVEFPEVTESGRYQGFVAPVIQEKAGVFVPSPPFQWQAPEAPTPTPKETAVGDWLMY